MHSWLTSQRYLCHYKGKGWLPRNKSALKWSSSWSCFCEYRLRFWQIVRNSSLLDCYWRHNHKETFDLRVGVSEKRDFVKDFISRHNYLISLYCRRNVCDRWRQDSACAFFQRPRNWGIEEGGNRRIHAIVVLEDELARNSNKDTQLTSLICMKIIHYHSPFYRINTVNYCFSYLLTRPKMYPIMLFMVSMNCCSKLMPCLLASFFAYCKFLVRSSWSATTKLNALNSSR